MRFGSVCSGIEAASVAWHPLGWQAAWLAEIEPFPSAVLAHHYPEVPNLGDMTKIAARILAGEIEAPDVLVGGTPCQAFSVAGLRKSLDDERGQLSLAFIHLADAIDAVRSVSGRSPATIVWENVPGVLSTSDNAFGCFLAGLVGEECEVQPAGKKWANAGCVYGPKRAAAWRILDAQYFGVAQRRRRVFVVASSRDWLDPAEVLFERSSLRRDSPPSRESGKDVAPTIRAGASNGGASHGARSGDSRDELIVPVASTGDISHCLNAGGMGRIDYETETMVVQCVTGDVTHTLKAEGFDASEDGTGRGQPIVVHGTQDPCVSNHTAFALGRNNGGENAIAFSCKNHGGDAGPVSPTLRSMGHDGSHANAGGQEAVAFAQNSRDEVRLMGGDGQIVGALAAEPGMKQTCYVAQAVSLRGREGGATAELGDEVCNCLRASCGGGDKAHVLAPVSVRDTSLTITSNYGKQVDSSDTALGPNVVFPAMQVRRLTPRECELLQGFPDDWTLIPWRNKPASECPDGPRYKALGNSMAVPVMRWIGRRIDQAKKGGE